VRRSVALLLGARQQPLSIDLLSARHSAANPPHVEAAVV